MNKKLEQITTEHYRVYRSEDGRDYISVTTAIGMCGGSDKTEALMNWASRNSNYKVLQEQARLFGTTLHNLAENVLNGIKHGVRFEISDDEINDLVWNAGIYNIPYEAAWGFRVIESFLYENIIDVIAVEETLYSDVLGLAGRVDCVVNMHRYGISVLDFKFSKTPRQSHDYALQLAIYKYMLEEHGYKIENTFNLFPNKNNKIQPYTLSSGGGKIKQREIELVAELAQIRHNG